MMTRIAKFEKQLIKGLISLHIERGHELNATEIEIEMMRITGENNEEHRYAIEDYIRQEIEKLN